ncbi:MarR family transcriptional regulator [Rhodococcus sp. IEGM 1379]|uniref:MarR family winged helix-turn-helix transcriptional regulator n=1 Tax=Rhodococcus sp. IEGM 1379 TaxID=3047086 RepID=UPI0024B866A0|nr:MarR family transcriptional regulator [Rhodococcus sp. IEGM 1379]MDI9914990.1 MarR family transcriptional regulator [Rhodococcus sp. IEGM 1379]
MTQDEIHVLWEDLGVFTRRLRTERSERGLSPTHIQALGHLNRSGPMTAKDLAQLERVTPQSIAKTIMTLEQQRMVTRRSDPSDGRANLIDLTELGTSTLRDDRLQLTQWLTDAMDAECTDAERDLLLIAGRILRRLGHSTSPQSPSAHPRTASKP